MRLVSVITPAYNAAALIGQTIESCLAQTYTHFELLIVDDGSTDDTAAIVEQYGRDDNRIRLVRTPNRGMSSARNIAMSSARGSLLACLDSDDLWFPDYLERQIGTLTANPSADIVTANAINLGGGHWNGQPYWPCSGDVRPISMLEIILREDAVHIFSVLRRSVVDRIGLFNENCRGNEDYEFWLRAAAAGCRFVADFTPRGYYRRRPGSASADEQRMLPGILTVLKSIQPYCRAGGAEMRAVDSQLKRFQRQLLVAEARKCLSDGDPGRAVEWLDRIPGTDRGPILATLLKISQTWPPLLLHCYRAKRAVGNLRKHLTDRPSPSGSRSSELSA
jgi:glycosyltransferase involved in cell wall biosynthesis